MTAREKLTEANARAWSLLVEAVLNGESVDAAKYKVSAIRWARDKGMSREEIEQFGQTKILSHHKAAKKNGHSETQRHLRWRVSAGLADAVEQDVVQKIAKELDITTSEQLWEFIHAVFQRATPAQLRHEAGMSRTKK